MTRQQKIRNPLFNPVFVPAVPAYQFSLDNVRLEQQPVQVPQHPLRLLVALVLERRVRRRLGFGGGEGGEAELAINPSILAISCLERMGEIEGERGRVYLRSSNFQRLPVDARQDAADERRLELELLLLELGVLEVQRERGRGGLAGFYGAGDEVCC